MAVNLITEDMFCGHQGEDLFDFERSFMTRFVAASDFILHGLVCSCLTIMELH